MIHKPIDPTMLLNFNGITSVATFRDRCVFTGGNSDVGWLLKEPSTKI